MMSIPRNERDCTATNQKETGRERYRERARREAQDDQATGHERMMETDAQTTSKPSPQGHSRGTGERGRAEKGGQTLLMHFDFVCLGGGSFALLFSARAWAFLDFLADSAQVVLQTRCKDGTNILTRIRCSIRRMRAAR